MREYTAWCEARHRRAFPASYKTVAGYLIEKVASLKGSAKSVSNMVSSLKVHSISKEWPWLTEGELHRLAGVRRQLDLEDCAAKDRKHPIVLSHITDALRQFWRPNDSRYDLLCATVALVAHNGLLRGGELLCGLQAKHVVWEPRNRSVRLHLPHTKTVRKGVGLDIRITDYKGHSAYKYLRRWFATMELYEHPERYVFPRRVSKTRQRGAHFDFSQCATKRWMVDMTKDMVEKLGHDRRLYSGHSYRAGGATDLFIMRVPYPQIKKYGRWASDAAMIYYRDDIEVSATVAKAFEEGARVRPHAREYQGVGVRA